MRSAGSTEGRSPQSDADALLQQLLTEGVDHRAAIDPSTGRNGYGCAPRADALPFGACSASEPDAELLAVLDADRQARVPLVERYRLLRKGLAEALELPPTTRIAFCPSGTDAVYLAVARALGDLRPLTVVAGGLGEMGRGTRLAIEGRHFTSGPPRPGAEVRVSELLAGWPESPCDVRDVPLRDWKGDPRPPSAIDADVTALCARAVARGGRVLVHVNAASKTGLAGPTLACVRALLAAHPGAVDVLVDAAQGRCAPAVLRAWLAEGATVLFTASKFFGAPCFAGALLWPAGSRETATPPGIGDYLCSLALPPDALPLAERWPGWQNVGLSVRWMLGVCAIKRYLGIPVAIRDGVGAAYAAAVRDTLARSKHARLLGRPDWSPEAIVLFQALGAGGEPLDSARLHLLHAALRDDGFLLGQPTELRPGFAALRLSLHAPLVARLSSFPDRGRAWLATRLARLTVRLAARLGDHG